LKKAGKHARVISEGLCVELSQIPESNMFQNGERERRRARKFKRYTFLNGSDLSAYLLDTNEAGKGNR
jgi:hypothetical protein